MSAKKHVIVPRNFVAGDLPEGISARSGCFDRYPRLTNREVRELEARGAIEPIGTSGRVWQLTGDLPARASRPTGSGRLSLEIPRSLQGFVAAEMRRRPSWVLEPIEI